MTQREKDLHCRLRRRIDELFRSDPELPRFKLHNKEGMRFLNIGFWVVGFVYPVSLLLLLEILDTLLLRADQRRDDDWWGEHDQALFLLTPYDDEKSSGPSECGQDEPPKVCPVSNVVREAQDIALIIEWLELVREWPVTEMAACGPPEAALPYWRRRLAQAGQEGE